MCGILAVLGCQDVSQAKRTRVLELSRRLKHTGPDWSGIYQHGNCFITYQRMAIVDLASGDQPLYSEDKIIVVSYEENGEDLVKRLEGVFSFILLDSQDDSFIVARDVIGITPLYMGWGLDGGIQRWYNPPWYSEDIPSTPYDPLELRQAFEKKSPDLMAAKEVSRCLGRIHHEFNFSSFSMQDGIDAIEDVIYHIETFDVTTVRASTPMFLMARKIKSLGVKMVLSGEGADEIFGGYLYFHKAPNKEEFHQEACRKIKTLHLYDCLRANKATAAWGVEVRVPFLDKDFINVAMGIDPEWKRVRLDLGRIEKWVLRKAFDDEENPFLPKVTDTMMTNAKFVYPDNTPFIKEAYFYKIFERFFPRNAAHLTVPGGPSVDCSTAKAIEWDVAWSSNHDPSGRAALGVHLSHYNNNIAQAKVSSDSDSSSDNNKQRMKDGEIREVVVRS